jgi:hypothetical protein
VCRILQADKRISKKHQKTRKKTAQEQNANGKHAVCDNVKKVSEKSSEAESLNI